MIAVRGTLHFIVVLATLLLLTTAEVQAAQGVGQGCSAFKPCGDGLSCIPFRQVCHRDSGARSGEACQAGYGCASGFTCEAGTQNCVGPGQAGDSCHATKPCGSGLTCEAGTQRCVGPGKAGDACHATKPCGSGLTCEAGTQRCVGPGGVGDACHATKPCGSGLSCQPGVQRCYHSPRQVGEPCVAGYPCGANLACQAGSQICSAGYPVQQCVYNQAGYVAEIKWFAPGTMKSTKTGDKAYTISTTASPIKTETIPIGQKSCVGGAGSKNWAVLTIKGGDIARVAAIVATDIGAVGATGGCWVGVAALTVVTAGGGAVAGVGCEVVTDAAVGVVADPSIIPNSKELFAVVQPAASGGLKPLWIIMYGTVFAPDTRTGRP